MRMLALWLMPIVAMSSTFATQALGDGEPHLFPLEKPCRGNAPKCKPYESRSATPNVIMVDLGHDVDARLSEGWWSSCWINSLHFERAFID
jgi:hypothetical protein